MRTLILCIALAGLFVATYLIWGDAFEEMLSGDEAAATLRSFGRWAWAVAILLLISDVLMPVPATAVIAALGVVYGPWLGGLIGCVGAYLAGAVAYGVCRAMGRGAAVWLMGEEQLDKSHTFFVKAGGWTVALSRWMIILPEMVSCLAGLTRMPARLYFTALACGVAPMCMTYAHIGAAGSQSSRPALALAISAALPVLIWPIAQYVVKRRAAR
ncbi:MAG: hypothetical protein GC159_18510 [Phycisphaera sp.]|nr:hypothetical protein [Phycisphaera sp.]